ncbi:MAG: anaerobic ribonucleoside-triphosphate reductase activating protein [Desulfovibrio sp.]|uniref:anaerobic ribonucleoside-triphosphate reductase activating protein n=1 Tax=Desulfovibrio sp. TaxID=885 RepID=UPI0039E6BCA6
MPEDAASQPMRLSGIVDESIVDGPGLRYVLFTQGCPHHCKGCHNPQTHSFDGGFVFTAEEALKQFGENPLLAGVTLSGGEPFAQAAPLCAVAQGVRSRGKTVITYTGYTFEDLWQRAQNDPWTARLLELTDLLIDGPYLEEFRDLELLFRGSSNQRLLHREDRDSLAAELQKSSK